jgi:hypothetical protein
MSARTGACPRHQLAAGERAVQVVVGARGQRGVGHPALRGDRQQPRLVDAAVVAQRAADAGGVAPTSLAVDDHEVCRRLVDRGERGLHVADRAGVLPGAAQPGLDLRLGDPHHEDSCRAPPHGSGIGHSPIIQPRTDSGLPRRARTPTTPSASATPRVRAAS